MSYIKTAIDSGDSTASLAIKPFHNFLVNNFRLMQSKSHDVFLDVEYLQLIFVIGGKFNAVEKTSYGNINKIRGKKAYSFELLISNEDWQSKQYNDFRDSIVELLRSGLASVEQRLTVLNKIKEADIFYQETDAVLTRLASLSPTNFNTHLTLIDEVLRKSKSYWEAKNLSSLT